MQQPNVPLPMDTIHETLDHAQPTTAVAAQLLTDTQQEEFLHLA